MAKVECRNGHWVREGMWDWDGACDPFKTRIYSGSLTFSVGIFQWVATKDGKRLKRGRVVKRVYGNVSDPNSVHIGARVICDEWNKRDGIVAPSPVTP